MNSILKLIIAVLLPPLGVLIEEGVGKQLLINIVLTIFGYLPGIIHVTWLIAQADAADKRLIN
jgi:uncharacterized membrane protein YqaE (UPF0057 family)